MCLVPLPNAGYRPVKPGRAGDNREMPANTRSFTMTRATLRCSMPLQAPAESWRKAQASNRARVRVVIRHSDDNASLYLADSRPW